MKFEYTQRKNGDAWEVQSSEIHLIECCDCGLVHDFAFVSADGQPIGIAAQRNEEQTAIRRALRIQRPPMLNERQTIQFINRFMRGTKSRKVSPREALREIINMVYVQGHRAGRSFSARSAHPADAPEGGKHE